MDIQISEIALLAMDTTLWSMNYGRIDVIAQSVFFKLGGRFAAQHVSQDHSGSGTGKCKRAVSCAFPSELLFG